MTWIDATFVLTVASTTALASERRLSGLLVGAGGVLAFRPLLGLAQSNPFLALALALVTGLVLALLGRHMLQWGLRLPPLAGRLAGGFGGLVLGVAIVIALVTSLPIGRQPLSGGIYYPPTDLPAAVQPAVSGSAAVAVGCSVLLQPLLQAHGDAAPCQRSALLTLLHDWFVVGEPWAAAP